MSIENEKHKVINTLETHLASATKIYELPKKREEKIKEIVATEIMPLLIAESNSEIKDDYSYIDNLNINDIYKQQLVAEWYVRSNIDELAEEKEEMFLACMQFLKSDPVFLQCWNTRLNNFQKCLHFMKKADNIHEKC